MKVIAKTGNEAMAYAMKQINPDVVAAYPITPATEVVQIFSNYVADGEVDTEFVAAESEHSALSACVGASVAGGRVMTSTASQGLALMHEILYIAAGNHLPIVIALVNRSLSAPINIHCDHSDTMGSREAGWMQFYSANSQEAYDSIIIALKVAETCGVPAIVSTDAFIISHCMDRLEVLEDEEVQKFIGEYNPKYYALDIGKPKTYGPLDLQDYFFEHKRSQIDAFSKVLGTYNKIAQEYEKLSGRYYPAVEEYRTDGAEVAIFTAGSTADTAKEVVDDLREQGRKIGLVRMRMWRPLPIEEIKKALSKFKAVAVMDRSDTMADFGGPVFLETRGILYDLDKRPIITDYVYGLGGRNVEIADIVRVYDEITEVAKTGKVSKPVTYLGVRGEE
ncbi:pyruvate ferredoxin oxidoreductase [candidate division WOR-3 bacterium]|uniref:Pyruvate ferredoxin oxidoreductase n=1 Tax=candidate division WOR-3 bacterium TaxID=2052148 RepID=A0A9D5QD48_UNCW3|nr:pyruvate ferredoxin oxidoreductase [candidate division WOR-3 bacterium]MBD3365249.1 pyruvate ferredoxin oxidoreductase [candidate division WOR-3 bacterium]